MIQGATSTTEGLGFQNLALGLRGSQRQESAATDKSALASGALTPEQQRQVNNLQQIDRKVHAHEQAHLAVGTDLVRGGASYTYDTGPDKKRYAVGGEVSIDASLGRTPEETVHKAQHIRAAALAPADPSPQDNSVAAQASRMESKALQEITAKQQATLGVATGGSATSLYRLVASTGNLAEQVGNRLDFFA